MDQEQKIIKLEKPTTDYWSKKLNVHQVSLSLNSTQTNVCVQIVHRQIVHRQKNKTKLNFVLFKETPKLRSPFIRFLLLKTEIRFQLILAEAHR